MTIGSEIEQVTVYARGARVRRITPAGISAGEVRITGLPLGLLDDTVRAEVIGGGAVVGLRVELDAATAAPRAGDTFDAEVRATRARWNAAQTEVARLGVALTALAALAPVSRRARPDGAVVPAWTQSLDARLAVLDLRVGREAELRAALAAAQREAKAAHAAVIAAQDRAARASSGRGLRAHELCKVVVATVDAVAATARVALEYLVQAARWAPTYCVRLGGAQAELELRAVIAQNSGEDWRGARLTLSTAEPMRFAELPELPMLRIGRRQPPRATKGFRAPPSGVDALYQDYDRAFAGRAPAGGLAPAAEPGFDEITRETTLPSLAAEAAFLEAPTGVEHAPLDDLDFADGVPPARSSRTRDQTERHEAPPAPSRNAPAPAAAMYTQSAAPRSKGRVLAGIGAMGAAPFGLVAAAGGAVADALTTKYRKTVAPGGAADDDVVELDQAAALLAYGELRMPGARDPHRGRLLRVGVFAQYGEALAARGHAIGSDRELARTIAERELAIEGLPLPPGTVGQWDHHYDHAFVGDAPVEVASDGTWHAISVTTRSAPVVVRHVVVPREGTEVYRLAELVNPLAAPLLPGPIDVFDDGVYLLTSRIDGVPAGAPVELGLGVDPKVKASRNTGYREEASGMLRGSLKLEHELTIEIANHSARAIDIEVRERLPVVPDGEDDIELVVTRTEPRWDRWSPPPAGPEAPRLKGGHRWRLGIGAGETRTLSAAYAIKIAAKHELVGGNRREAP